MPNFDALDLPDPLRARLAALGFTEPTPIQEAALPAVLAGKDALIQAPTGTGKTLTYLLPLVAHLDPGAKGVQAVVISPSRELAMQILQVLQSLLEGTGLIAQPLIGGANVRHQIDRLKKHPQVVVGTPGRLAELISGGKLKLSQVRTLVVDEADMALGDTFKNELIRVLKATPRTRHTLFVSATVSPAVEEVLPRWLQDAVRVQVAGPRALPATLTHGFVVSEPRAKVDTLRRLLHACAPQKALIFANEGSRTMEIASKLAFKGLSIEALHGEASKQDRGAVIRGFREGKFQVLVATELGARGLDLPGVTHVFNLDLPTDSEHYLHRAGRTGRMGQPGEVVSVVTPAERFVVDKFAKALEVPFTERALSHGELVAPEVLPAPEKKARPKPKAESGPRPKPKKAKGGASKPKKAKKGKKPKPTP